MIVFEKSFILRSSLLRDRSTDKLLLLDDVALLDDVIPLARCFRLLVDKLLRKYEFVGIVICFVVAAV